MSIQAPRILLSLGIALPLALSSVPALAQTHDHGHAASAALTLDHGRKWDTDAPLRQAMGNLARAVSQNLPAAHAGTLTDAQYDALGAQANREFAYIVENCKLTPQADAVLHVILGDMVNGAEAIGGKQADQPRSGGVVRLAQALNRYGEYFNHPGWQDIQLPH